MKVLIVEDEPRMGAFIVKALTEQSYTVQLVRTCATARDALAEAPVGAVVLDLGLPDGDGLDLLREWRAAGFNEPVLILGADDSLPKPFGMDELLARLRSLLRRQAGVKTTVLTHGDLRVDLLARTVTSRSQRVVLTNREFALVELFLQNPGRVLTRTFIAEHVWQASYDLGTNLIDVYVRRIRQKLEVPGEKPFIQTVRGMGYQLA